MVVNTKLLINEILANNSFQLMVPVYQRNYEWDIPYCEELFVDLCKMSKVQKNYFLGTFLFKEQKGKSNASLKTRIWIIDGQQRITTIYALIFAIKKVFSDNAEIVKWCDSKLFNDVPDEKKQAKLKLKLIKTDNKVLDSFIFDNAGGEQNQNSDDSSDDNSELEDNEQKESDNCLGKAILYLIKAVKDNFRQESPEIDIKHFIYDVLEKIQVVEIDVEKKSENEQSIFDHINATGERLNLADLVRNFLMIGYETYQEMKEVYDAKWVPIEQLFSYNQSLLNKFMESYLTAKFYSNSKFAMSRKITYTLFKDWFYDVIKSEIKDDIKAKQFILDDLLQFAKYYLVVLSKNEDLQNMVNDHLIGLFKYFSLLDIESALPFLLLMFDDYIKQKITISNFEYATYLIIDYLIRLGVCTNDKRELNIIFSELYLIFQRHLTKEQEFKKALNNSLRKDIRYGFADNERFIYHLKNDELTDEVVKTILAICNYGIFPSLNNIHTMNTVPFYPIPIFNFKIDSHHFHETFTIANLTLTANKILKKCDYEAKYKDFSNSQFTHLTPNLPTTGLVNDYEEKILETINKRFNYLLPIILQNLPDFINEQNNDASNAQSIQLPG